MQIELSNIDIQGNIWGVESTERGCVSENATRQLTQSDLLTLQKVYLKARHAIYSK